jgi:hypothetical protein
MNTSEDRNSPLEPEKDKPTTRADASQRQETQIDEAASFEKGKLERVVPRLSQEDRARFQKEYDVHIHSYEFYLEYGLKAVAVFYAVIGGILSVYFGSSRRVDGSVLIVLLGLPVLMSLILGTTFLWGACKWHRMSKHIKRLVRRLRIHKPPDIVLLTSLLLIFGSLYILTGGALLWLMLHWINVSPI